MTFYAQILEFNGVNMSIKKIVEHVFSSLVNPKPSSLGVAFALTFLHIERACACYYYSLIIGLKPKE
jgi:hypothetical protein